MTHEDLRSVAKYEQLREYDRLRARRTELWCLGKSTTAIAKRLHEEGFRTLSVEQAAQSIKKPLLPRKSGLLIKQWRFGTRCCVGSCKSSGRRRSRQTTNDFCDR